MVTYRYSRWDGTQEVFTLDAEDLMDRLSEHLMSSGDLHNALRSLMQESLTDPTGTPRGIDSVLQKLRQQRKETLERHDLDSVMRDIDERLDTIEAQEREGIARKLEEVRQRASEHDEQHLADVTERVAERNLQALDEMPPDAASRIGKLRDYEFMDDDARQSFQELVESLRQQVLEHHFKGLTQQLQSMDQDSLGRLSDVVRDLNQLMRERLDGGQPDFEQFKKDYQDFFGPNGPNSLDELAQQMQQRIGQMESLLNSMSPEMRRQLSDLVDSLLQDSGLLDDMAELAQNLERLSPSRGARREYPFSGDDELTLDQALQMMEQLQGMDTLESQLKNARDTANLSGVDTGLLKETLGEEALHQMDSLKGVIKELEESGYISRTENRYELTPKGTRRIGQKALAEIFAYIRRNGAGQHSIDTRGDGGDYVEDTKRYEFGDTFAPHLQKSLFNAVSRQSSEAGSGGMLPLRLQPDDLEVYRTERVARSSTVLMIDLSLSMAMRGSFLAAKKVALALNNLIRTRFPHDSLYVVGFSTYARELKPDALPFLNWDEFDPYTNIQHALIMAQKLLTRSAGGTKQIIMVSDGEPTAHVEHGQLYLQYPPNPRTLTQTLEEVKRCSSKGIVINTFMLDRNAHLKEFVDRMSRISRGRVFYTSPEQLGHYIVVDYVSNRRHVVR